MERVRLPVYATLKPSRIARMRGALNGTDGLVTLEGADGVFCRGVDLDWLAAHPQVPDDVFRDFAALLDEIATAPLPVVSVIDGVAAGGGVALGAAADLCLATPRATFALPEVFAGLAPAVALPWVARRTGWPRARLLALTGRTIDADEALALGLVDVVTADPEAELRAHLGRFRRADPDALATVKRITADLDRALERQQRLLARPETRARVARLAAGEAPWETGD